MIPQPPGELGKSSSSSQQSQRGCSRQHEQTLCCSPWWSPTSRLGLHSLHLPLLLLYHVSSAQGQVKGQLQTKSAMKSRLGPGNSGCPIFLQACPTLCEALVLISPGLTSGSAAGRAPWLSPITHTNASQERQAVVLVTSAARCFRPLVETSAHPSLMREQETMSALN